MSLNRRIPAEKSHAYHHLERARERNIGWRIDYRIATPGIAKLARKATIYTREVFSDHAPVIIDYDYDL